MKWCIIGAGGIADRRTIPAILSDKNNKIVAIMDKNAELIKNLSLKYGVKGYTDEEEMLSKEDCDCVYIGTPVFCHYSNAMTALKFNKHAFIEKPIGLNAKEGYEILSAFKKADKQFNCFSNSYLVNTVSSLFVLPMECKIGRSTFFKTWRKSGF